MDGIELCLSVVRTASPGPEVTCWTERTLREARCLAEPDSRRYPKRTTRRATPRPFAREKREPVDGQWGVGKHPAELLATFTMALDGSE